MSGGDAGGPRILVTVSGTVDPDTDRQVAEGVRPRPDYSVFADVMGADLLDHEQARATTGQIGRIVARVAGGHALVAWECFRRRDRYDAVLTDGEQVGIPLALLWRFVRRRTTAHVMIVHILSVRKKSIPFRLLGLRRAVDAMIVYSSWQQRFASERLRMAPDRVVRSPYTVDTQFFAPSRATPSAAEAPVVATAGLERRDYSTLVEAARSLPEVEVVIAAASNWSTRRNELSMQELPANVDVRSLPYVPLRQLYADAAVVVMPLHDVEFQAGVTTILEAMAMAKPIVCTRTRGQTDVVTDGETGVYVPPGDPGALGDAVRALIDDPARAEALGAAGRRFVETACDVEVYAREVADVVERAVALKTPARARRARSTRRAAPR